MINHCHKSNLPEVRKYRNKVERAKSLYELDIAKKMKMDSKKFISHMNLGCERIKEGAQ